MRTCPDGRMFASEAAATIARPGATVRPHGDHFHAVKGLARGQGLTRTPFRRAPVEPSQRAVRAARDTGPDAATRRAVYEREGNRCAACGIWLGESAWKSVQHRKARGVGGGNELSNLVLLCGSATSPGCHRKAEDRDPGMHARGYWIRSDEDPSVVPVMVFEPDGSGLTVWLTDDGHYADEAGNVLTPAGRAS